MHDPTQIQERLKKAIGMHVLVYTEPCGTVEGTLLHVMGGWLTVQENPNIVTSSEGCMGARALLPIRRIVTFRAYVLEKKPAKKKSAKKAKRR